MSENKGVLSTVSPSVLTICTYTEFAPFSYEDGGEIVGTDISLLKAFAQEIHLEVEIIKRAFAGLWEAPGKGECDVSAAGMMEYRDRILGDNAVWSNPYIVVTPTSSAHIDGDVRYKTIGATIIPVVPSQKEIVSQLLSGQIDAFGEGDVSNEYLAGKYLDENGERLLVLTDLHPMKTPEFLRFAVRSVDQRLPEKLNKFIKKI